MSANTIAICVKSTSFLILFVFFTSLHVYFLSHTYLGWAAAELLFASGSSQSSSWYCRPGRSGSPSEGPAPSSRPDPVSPLWTEGPTKHELVVVIVVVVVMDKICVFWSKSTALGGQVLKGSAQCSCRMMKTHLHKVISWIKCSCFQSTQIIWSS